MGVMILAGPLGSQHESMIPAGAGQQGFLGGAQGSGGHGGGGGGHSGSGSGAGHCLTGGGAGLSHSGSPQPFALSTVVMQPQKTAIAGMSFFKFVSILLSPFLVL